jgi:hypothetical protein
MEELMEVEKRIKQLKRKSKALKSKIVNSYGKNESSYEFDRYLEDAKE